MADLTECLRTYDALQLWRDAEDVLRRDVLREFVKKVLPHTSLPHAMLNWLKWFLDYFPWCAPNSAPRIRAFNTVPNT